METLPSYQLHAYATAHCFDIDEIAKTHFGDDGVFDQIYTKK